MPKTDLLLLKFELMDSQLQIHDSIYNFLIKRDLAFWLKLITSCLIRYIRLMLRCVSILIAEVV